METPEEKKTELPVSPRDLGFYYSLANVGIEMTVPIGLGVLADNYLGTVPWLTAVLAVFGFIAGLTHLIVLLQQKAKRDAESGRQP